MKLTTKVRHKTADEIVWQCKKQKVPYYEGILAIRVGQAGCGTAIYMPATGHFFGIAMTKSSPRRAIPFDSRTGRHDATPWMKQLRAFFHEEIKE